MVFLAANISIPPMIPFILYASFWTGALVQGENRGDLSPSQMQNLSVIYTNFQQYALGAVVLAVVAALVVGLLSYSLLKWRQNTRVT